MPLNKVSTRFANPVSIRSRSLVARWDFGQNARNIRALQSELDGALE